MFKLQRLEITGFKSFADPTEVVFTGSGITAVVGPNGCGKSNVSDAISWVLGEQRAKQLRGGEMKDVIFQGTRDRKPSGMAEVVLHLIRDEEFFDPEDQELEDIDATLSELDDHLVDLDEIVPEDEAESETAEAVGETDAADAIAETPSDSLVETNGFHDQEIEIAQAAQVGSAQVVQKHVKTKRHWRPRSFALDFAPGEAVSVGRRLYLSGESEYTLNGRNCRLRDIQDLFAGTGLSGSHYAIIEQGRIGQILSAKPADRRNLIEEAAGISKFRTRQRAAEARLEGAKTNLARIYDIVTEIEKQVNSLRRQAAKTRRYKILQEEYRVLMRQFFAAEGKFLSDLIADLGLQLERAIQREHELAAEVEAKEQAVREATHRARECEDALTNIRQLHSANALERDRAEREHRYQAEQIVALNHRIEALLGEIASTKQRQAMVADEIERLQIEERQERELAAQTELALREAEAGYQAKLDIVSQVEIEADRKRGELLQHTAAVERFSEIARQLAANLERLSQRIESLTREAERAESAFGEHQVGAQNLVSTLQTEAAKLASYQEEKQGIVAQSVEARDRLHKAETALSTIKEEYSRKRNRLETLQELEVKRAVYAPPVQKLFAAQDEIGVRLSGVLADRFRVEARWERAIETLFGPLLQTVIVENFDDAKRTASWLQANEIGRNAILIVPASNDGFDLFRRESTALEAILGVDPAFGQLLRDAFPREMSAELVENFDGREAQDGSVLVDAAGNILYGSRLMISGSPSANAKNSSLLAFKRELLELDEDAKRLTSEIEAAQAKVNECRADLGEREERVVDLQSLIIKIERGLHGLEIQERSARQEIDRAERHRKVVADEIDQTKQERIEIERKIEEADANKLAADEQRIAASDTVAQIGQRLATARADAEADAAILNEKRMTAATSAERLRSAQSALRRAENEHKELASRYAAQNLEVADTEGKVSDLRESIYTIADKIASAETEITREREEIAQGAEILATARFDADRMNEELSQLNHVAAEARNERGEIEIRQAEAQTRLENINERCAQELHILLPQLIETEELPEDFDLDASRAQADDLRERLENFGAVNMLAVDELAEAEERHIFLTSQQQDIIDSIATAEEALREIKERSRERFKNAFEAINANFTQFFQELFGGGRGEMTLLEADDILEAGIEVVAQPPGKRLQNILLLSGGEKAMAAIALVLSIFKYRPSPFCLLDEVDAPLDEANVGRFVGKIAEMAEKTQFIVITHNKKTMEAARALYGVTMQEAGVSKIVSVKFE
jgi:chromosome segregation protein